MTAGITYSDPARVAPDQVALVIEAMGQLMRSLHEQDLALQDAVSKLTAGSTSQNAEISHIQHIDLVTQTHDDLARFLPELAATLIQSDFDSARLSKLLRLQSLRERLLAEDEAAGNGATPSGDLSLF